LNKILRNTEKGGWSLNMVNPNGTPTTSTNKYSKIPEEKQE